MGRTVSRACNSSKVFYFEISELGNDENGNYDEDLARIEHDDLMGNLEADMKARFSSMYSPDSKACVYDNECTPILKNGLVTLYLSEYCGMFSLSIVCNSYCDKYHDWRLNTKGIEENYCDQIEKGMKEIIMENATLLHRTGSWTFERVN